MSYETLVTIGVISLGLLATICFVVYQVFETRRMRIQYDNGYNEDEIKEMIHDEIDPLLNINNKANKK